MCGIVGFVQNNVDNSTDKLQKCLQSIKHRGPDGEGTFIEGSICLGHTLLKIIDKTELSQQPFVSFNKKYIITYNGELYNTKELRERLKRNNFIFRTKSDTEVVINAYINWGKECVKYFNGMFSFCIYDSENQILFLARDRFGEKPLYYSMKDKFAFASELDPFKIFYPDIQLNDIAINHFLSIGYVLHPNTIYEDVFSLPPSSYITYDIKTNKIKLEKYYDYLSQFENKLTEPIDQLAEQIYSLLNQSVLNTITGDFPFGIFLSGGIDSSTIAYLLSSNNINYSAFNIRFSNTKYDEYAKAINISKMLNLNLSSIDLGNITKQEIDEYIRKIDYLTFDNAGFPLFKLSSLARKTVKYSLSGDGADEIFGGYSTYKADDIALKIKLLIPLIKHSKLSGRLSVKNDKVGSTTKMNRFLKGLDKDYQKSHYNWRRIFSPSERIQILGKEKTELILETDPFHQFAKYYKQAEHLSKVDQHLFVDSQTWLSDNILIKTDRNSMLAGLETRSPFLDKELVSFVASCPSNYKKDKLLLKKAMENYLPKTVVNQTKSGLNAPVGKWFNTKNDEFQYFTKYIYNLKYST